MNKKNKNNKVIITNKITKINEINNNNIYNDKIFSLNKFRKIKVNEYDKKESCELNKKKWIQTNPRFETFDQT
jgi:hypothetical protein